MLTVKSGEKSGSSAPPLPKKIQRKFQIRQDVGKYAKKCGIGVALLMTVQCQGFVDLLLGLYLLQAGNPLDADPTAFFPQRPKPARRGQRLAPIAHLAHRRVHVFE